MKKTIEKYFCDICGEETKDIKHLNYPVIFQTEQTEGRIVEPYIDNTNIDVCPNCCKKILRLSARAHKDITVIQYISFF